MIDLSIHKVEKIELLRAYPMNGNSRTIRITAEQTPLNEAVAFELTLYGETDALDSLPKADDYRLCGFRTDCEAA